ncbi:MAG: TIGR04282 family arsenosugar biosynthesis glycosyltransferase [candidate division NC10 bacterium]|nr:TIGR04282 family arsenosugar biosynthesis glycosyltransferase [candidate division NC10 bacterium]
MAKAPLPGGVKTRLCPPLVPEQAASLARCFLLDSLAKARGTAGTSTYLAYSPAGAQDAFRGLADNAIFRIPQQGHDLGERMDRLSRRLLGAGHPAVIILGTDTPTLPASILAGAVVGLAGGRAELVLGPSEDGGYYLIGLRRPLSELFVGISWGTPTVLAETRERAGRLGLRTTLLPTWYDVDTPPDLARLQAELRMDRASTAPHTAAFLQRLTLGQ